MAISIAKYRIELFGGIRVIRHDDDISRFRTQKTAGLLAYLALHLRTRVTREQLIELFWPDLPPDAARNNLSTALSSLRSQLEPPGTKGRILQADNLQVGLNPDAVTTDVVEFEQLLELAGRTSDGEDRSRLIDGAIALYSGDLMFGFYEEWALPTQARLRERYAEALRASIDLHCDLGRTEEAIDAANRLIEHDPLDEQSYLAKMRLLGASGRHAAVTETIEALQNQLSREVGAAPSESLIAEARSLALESKRRRLRSSSASISQHPPESAASNPSEGAESRNPAIPPTVHCEEKAVRPTLPMQLTRFFGRSREVETLRAWLKPDGPSIRDLAGDDRPRLVTVTGAGGAGKTRLAVEAASVLGAEYGGKVYFVGLAEIPDPGLLSYRLCHALNLHVAEGAEPIEYLASRREEGPVLLVLDNFEHLLRDDDTGPKTDSPIGSAAVAWVHHLLQSAPQVRCLVTSRRCLGLSGEQDLPLASLAMPNFRSTPLELSECASVQLYVDRARKVKPDFAITKNNADVVAELCRRLEGMPLAIELAAAWARSMTPARMLERLAQRLDSLAARQRDLPERHRSMRAVCEWSYALLSPELQRTFELLSVFHAGFDLGAAEAVCGPSAAEQLQQLQEHSLVILEESEYREARFRMLEALNQFAFEMHEARAEADLDRERHAAYYASLMKRRNEQNVMPREWVPLIMSEYENVRAALLWYMADDARAEAAMILAGDMLCAWKWRGENSEGLMLLRSILAHPANQEPSLHRAEALNALGSLSLNQAETAEARQCYEESLSIYRQIGTPALVAGRLYNLALAASQDGEYEVSRRLTEEALAMLGEDADPAKVASYRGHLGVLAQRANDFSLAREHLECAVAAQRRLDDMVNLSDTLCNLGNLCYREKDYDAALRYYEETLIETKDTGIAEDTLYPLCGFAAVALEIGEPERAVRLYSAFENGLAAIGIELPKEYWGPRDQAHARLRAALGDAVYKACSAEGKGWTLEQAVDYALRRTACPTRA